jgi:probable dihydroxyacetone kinase regulator
MWEGSTMLRTKIALSNALKKQLEIKSLNKITITHLVEDCGLIRQTFYYHFNDINDLCKWTFSRDLIEIISDNKNADNWQQGCLATMYYLKDNSDMVYNIVNSVDRKNLDIEAQRGTEYIITQVINDTSKGMNISQEDKKFMVTFYRTVLLGIIEDWIESGMKEEPVTVVDRLNKILQGNIQISLERFEKETVPTT